MKKKIIAFFVIVSLLSCNNDNDDNSVAGTTIYLTAIINGTPISFDSYELEKQVNLPSNGNSGYTDLIVTFRLKSDTSKRITFRLAEFETGTETCYYTSYDNYEEGIDYDTEEIDNPFIVNITVNDTQNLKGTFSGTLKDFNSSRAVTILEGNFDIKY